MARAPNASHQAIRFLSPSVREFLFAQAMLAYSMVGDKPSGHNSRITHWMDGTVANWWMPEQVLSCYHESPHPEAQPRPSDWYLSASPPATASGCCLSSDVG